MQFLGVIAPVVDAASFVIVAHPGHGRDTP